MQNRETSFAQISSKDPIGKVIRQAFGMELDVVGGWGYQKSDAIFIRSSLVPINQMQHTIASMRTHLEMNLTLPKDQRYGGINLKEISRDSKSGYTVVQYAITAMLESDYKQFIDEYKKGYGKKEFDIQKHFQDRELATLKREIAIWFDKS